MTHSPNHVHLNNVPHELGEYAVLLIGRDGKLLDHIFLRGHEEYQKAMDLALLEGKPIKLGCLDILTGDECL